MKAVYNCLVNLDAVINIFYEKNIIKFKYKVNKTKIKRL